MNISAKRRALEESIRKAANKEIPKDMPLPVRYDGMHYYWGPRDEMVADFDEGVNTGDGFRIRGWGRIQDEKGQDACAYFIERAINAYSEVTLDDVLRAIEKVLSDAGVFTKAPYEETFCDVVKKWHLGKSIANQPDEAIEYLYPIICRNEE